MDAKALAKSKRAHSLRHSKKHNPHQASKVPSVISTTSSKKPADKKVGEDLKKSHGSRALPSNWDRYDEEFELGSEGLAGESTSQPTEFVVPKSKGADYAYLISEAKAQQQLNYSSDIFPSFNDVLDDFTQGFGPLLSAKGQSVLSWIAEDDFDFEDKGSTSFEYILMDGNQPCAGFTFRQQSGLGIRIDLQTILLWALSCVTSEAYDGHYYALGFSTKKIFCAGAPFLSLNLHALAEQLEKAKPSERLYITPDVLPPELLNDELQAHGEDEHDHVQTRASAVEIASEASSLSQDSEKDKNAQHYQDPVSPATTITRNDPVATAREGLHSTNQIKDELWDLLETEQKPISRPQVDSAARKPAIFEAANVEAELDMLLNSFSETKFLESSNAAKKLSNGSEIFKEEMHTTLSVGISPIPSASASVQKKSIDSMKHPLMSANIDDAIDNLLEETSNLVSVDGGSLSREVKAFPDDTQSKVNTSSKSKLLDDFDSWLDTI